MWHGTFASRPFSLARRAARSHPAAGAIDSDHDRCTGSIAPRSRSGDCVRKTTSDQLSLEPGCRSRLRRDPGTGTPKPGAGRPAGAGDAQRWPNPLARDIIGDAQVHDRKAATDPAWASNEVRSSPPTARLPTVV